MFIRADIIFFDLDGVLIDSREAIRHSLNKTFEKRGLRKLRPGEEKRFIGPPLHDIIRAYLREEAHEEMNVQRLIDEYRESYGREGIEKTVLFPDVPEILEHFEREGKRSFITTTKPVVFAEPILRRLGIRGYFEDVFGTVDMDRDELEKGEVLELAFSKVKSRSVVIVGDRRTDIEAGKRHGIWTIGVTYGVGSEEEIQEAGPDAIVHRVTELIEAIH